MKVNILLEEEPFVFCAKNADGSSLYLDASPSIGGKGKGMRPMEVLASSLAGCMSIDVLLILRKQRQEVTHFEIDVTANRVEGVPSPFELINLEFIVNTEVNSDKLKQAIALSHEKYCSVSASLSKEIRITTSIRNITNEQL